MTGLSDRCEDLVILDLIRLVTIVWQTDRQTDRRTEMLHL